ncbi:DNA polymerase II [archaeon HR01]|nr:DNA polymerase II [archaeon HR01]
MTFIRVWPIGGGGQVSGRYFLLGAGYDGQERLAYLKMLDPETQKVIILKDKTGHKPYCFTDKHVEELRADTRLREAGAVDFIPVTKYDPLKDTHVVMTKIVASDPLDIGGTKKSIRELIPCWEADIQYHLNYIYDMRIIPSLTYVVEDGGLRQEYASDERILEIVRSRFGDLEEDDARRIAEWLRVLEADHPHIDFVALDIEILAETPTRVPSYTNPVDPVVAISLSGTKVRKVLMLDRKNGYAADNNQYVVENFSDEKEMLLRAFEIIGSHPVVITFNGDDFDLPYLRSRAEKLGVSREQIPIQIGRDSATLKSGIHLDLYRFFNNKSVQVYAFDNRYREFTLDGISTALLGKGKVQLDKTLSELTPQELADYCYRDAEILRELVEASDRLIIRLMAVISRISRMPLEDVCRHGVSGWIRNLLYWELRGLNWLIPRKEDILNQKGGTVTKAIIEGKKYRGAIVVEPVPGIHFNVTVLDFASLYPSILKEYNLSFETINCRHDECRSNTIPETPHWVCRKSSGIQSSVIGVIRDIRVRWYKPKASDRTLPQEVRGWYDVVQKALKVFLNASYGVLGFEEFPLYCPPLAESTTAIGRYVFMSAIEKAKSLGIQVIYGDTDSIFLKSDRPEKISEIVSWASSNFRLDLEFDKIYRYVVFSRRKKNYLGVTEKSVVEVKGLTGKKRNIPVFIKEAFDEMLRKLAEVRTAEDLERVKTEIRSLLASWYRRLKDRTFEPEELAFRVMLSKSPERYEKTTPQHVKAARKLQERGVKVVAGDIIRYVKTKDREGVSPVQFARKENIDIDKYIEYMRSTFEQVLDPLEMDFESIVGATSLESFL